MAEVRAALADQIAAGVPGLRTSATVPSQVSPPLAVIRPGRGTVVEYEESFDAPETATTYFMEVVLLVSLGNDRSGQALLDEYVSASGIRSVYLAIEANPTLGGLVSAAHVERARGYGLIEYAGVEYLGSTLEVQVLAP